MNIGQTRSRNHQFALRVAVACEGGIGSAIWRIWKGKNNDNIYIAPRNIAGSAKGTLHDNRYCHFGITKQEATTLGLVDRPMLETWIRLDGPPDGAVKAMSILIAHEFLSPGEPLSAGLFSVDDPGPGKAVTLDLFFSRAVPGSLRLSPSQRELGRVVLCSGEHFSVVADVIEFDVYDFARKNPAVFSVSNARIMQIGPASQADRVALLVRADGFANFCGVIDIGGVKII